MSTIKERVHRKNASGTYDVLHFETEASVVYMSDGSTTVEEAIQARAPQSHTHTVSQITDLADWAKQPTKPTYTYSEVGAAAASHTHTRSQITDFPSSMPASDVYSWAKQPNKPSYSYSEVGAAPASHTHTASQVTAGTLAGPVIANVSAVATVTTAQVRNIYAGTADLTAGASGLTSGYIYLVYE